MLIACWSVKGGSGTTVVAAALALLASRTTPEGGLLVDLGGDGPAVLGLPDPSGPGVSDWLAAPDSVADGALARLEIDVRPGLALLPTGTGPPARAERATALSAALAQDVRGVVVDVGSTLDDARLEIIGGATQSLLVLRPCFLALRRATLAPIRPSGVVLVREAGRALGRRDVEDVLGVPVRAEVDVEPAVARAVDAGLLAGRLPRGLAQALRRAA